VILPVQPRLQKYFRFRPTQIKSISFAIPFPQEGRIAIVTDVGCGMQWTRQRGLTSGADVDGEVVWS
jgi:hypothetical protein